MGFPPGKKCTMVMATVSEKIFTEHHSTVATCFAGQNRQVWYSAVSTLPNIKLRRPPVLTNASASFVPTFILRSSPVFAMQKQASWDEPKQASGYSIVGFIPNDVYFWGIYENIVQ